MTPALTARNEQDAMHYRTLATDYDGTIAENGVVDAPTLDGLERLRGATWRLILVTGRDVADLQQAMPRLGLFDLVVAENGALLYDPASHAVEALAEAPPPIFLKRLGELGVAPLWLGRVIVATSQANAGKVASAIRDLGLDLQITFNRHAIMVLPSAITKASGLRGALARLGVSPADCIGVGDNANDLAFLDVCGLSVAVANALPAVKQRAALVTTGMRGAGVVELVNRVLAMDFAASSGVAEPARVTRAADGDYVAAATAAWQA